MPAIKVATCCYCGTKAALVLTGKVSHELSCGTCGAPLSKMRMLPKQAEAAAAPRSTALRPSRFEQPCTREKMKRIKLKKKSKIRYLGRKIFSEIWDVVDDILD